MTLKNIRPSLIQIGTEGEYRHRSFSEDFMGEAFDGFAHASTRSVKLPLVIFYVTPLCGIETLMMILLSDYQEDLICVLFRASESLVI